MSPHLLPWWAFPVWAVLILLVSGSWLAVLEWRRLQRELTAPPEEGQTP